MVHNVINHQVFKMREVRLQEELQSKEAEISRLAEELRKMQLEGAKKVKRVMVVTFNDTCFH